MSDSAQTCLGCSNTIFVEPAEDALLKQPTTLPNGLLCHGCNVLVADQARECYAQYLDSLPEPEAYAHDVVFIDADAGDKKQ